LSKTNLYDDEKVQTKKRKNQSDKIEEMESDLYNGGNGKIDIVEEHRVSFSLVIFRF
jgi:hypothetical protein